MKVFLSELAKTKLLNLLTYLDQNWGVNAKEKFIEKLSEKIKQISSLPESCPISKKIEGVRKCVFTKQTTLFYRVSNSKNEVEIITIIDNRQHPNNLNIELNPLQKE